MTTTAIAATVAKLSTAGLVALYNELTGKGIKKFQDRATAERRVTEAATPAALLAACYCPHCAGHSSSQTMAGKEGSYLGDHCQLCHECGVTYDNSTGAEVKERAAAASSETRTAGVAASWADPAVRAARSARYGVKVSGNGQYSSVAKAFAALGLDPAAVIRVRGELVREGTVKHAGRTFHLVPRTEA